jgi:hypothetical protein
MGAAAAASAAILGLIFILFPRLKPAEPPKERIVTLSNPQVSFESYGDDAVIVSFLVQVDGYQGVPLFAMWTLYDPDTGEEVNYWPRSAPSLGAYTVHHKGPQVKADVQKQSFSPVIHIPGRPKADGSTWKIKLEIVDTEGNRLAGPVETDRFSVPEAFTEHDPYGPR